MSTKKNANGLSKQNGHATTTDVSTSIERAAVAAWAVIRFQPDGTILSVNDVFRSTMGYGTKDKLEGLHHSVFCKDELVNSPEYSRFWSELAAGNEKKGEFQRLKKDGSEVWLNATYSPVLDNKGQVKEVIKIASDITEMVNDRLIAEHLTNAVDVGWASIQFLPDGHILSANKNFLSTLGYEKEEEVVGQHHRVFCDAAYARSLEYTTFWNELAAGQVKSGEFRRVSKDGKEVWINASYTPVTDVNGKVIKVIKIASDITDMVIAREKGENVKSAGDTGWAYIEFTPQGEIIDANNNFIAAMGYHNADEIKDKHHRIFCEPEYANSAEYKEFWKDLASGHVQNGEYLRVKKDGTKMWLQAAYTPIQNEDGEVVKVIKIATDISAVKFPVMSVNEIVNKMAQGDLTSRFEMQAEGYVKDMGLALNEAIENLNGLLSTIDEGANQVANAADSMLDRTKSMKNNTTEVASAIAQMSEGAQDQASKTDESSKLTQEVLASSTEMENHANLINSAAEKGKKECEEGLNIVQNLVENMKEITSSATLTSDSIKVLTERADEIARTLKVITEIAGQTNLLALNAAIEAARAGDAGRGFAVVAEEIRKLAEDSRSSAVDIEKIITDVQKDTQEASKAIVTMEESVLSGTSATSKAESIFQEISSASEETFQYSLQIQQTSSGQKSAIDRVVKNIEQIVVVAEETAAGAQQVASSSQELDGSMENIAAASNQLAAVANELQSGVSQFKLKK